MFEQVCGSDLDDLKPLVKGMYGFDDPIETAELVDKVSRDPSKYVLKPQREGGGNNIFGDDILPFLDKHEDLWQYSLMD